MSTAATGERVQQRRNPARWVLPVLWTALTIAIVMTARALPWSHAVNAMQRASPGWFVAAVLLNLAILPLWALEWRLLVPGSVRVGFRDMFGIVGATASVLNSIPFLAGEASAVGLLIIRGGLSRGAALSVLAMDQVLVAFGKLTVIGLALLLAPLPAWLRQGGGVLVVVFAGALAILVPLAHGWSNARLRVLETTNLPGPLRHGVAALLSWGTHLDALRQPSRLWRAASLSLLKKGAELGAIIAVQVAIGMDPSLPLALGVLAGLALSTLVPIAPANLGVYEATVFAMYRLGDVAPAVALGAAIIQHLAFLIPSLATGYLVLTWEQARTRFGWGGGRVRDV